MTRRLSSYLLGLAGALLAGCSQSGPALEISLPMELAGSEFPVAVELPESLPAEVGVWRIELKSPNGDSTVYAQSWQESPESAGSLGPRRLATFLWDPASGSGPCRLVFRRPEKEPEPAFTFFERDGKFLDLAENGRPVLSYVFGMNLAEGVPEDRRRASYIHPVYGLDGEVLSDDFPSDHYHHRGIFWTWPQVFVQGEQFSLWDIRGIYQRFEKWLVRNTGPLFADIGVQNGWYAGERRVVDEKVFFRVYRAGETVRVIDFTLRWEAIGTPVSILGSPDIKGYGGFSLRFAPFTDPQLTNAAGRQAEDSNLVPSAWADLSARFGGGRETSGAAIFDHSGNLDHPNGWCLRHYGFVGIAWPGLEPFVLQPGDPLTARYRVVVHRGDAGQAVLARAYQAYLTF